MHLPKTSCPGNFAQNPRDPKMLELNLSLGLQHSSYILHRFRLRDASRMLSNSSPRLRPPFPSALCLFSPYTSKHALP
ncbi:uncharacterized protein MYCGRDRAFT_105480 [Zymoseptoria tritici IPO323]|uniref:Uncharacterized protein n=1 Tax=Zymoseptoria tritici (strain CBS 115943 / IPO323) TaxID=336722 RepID=F9XHW3_ZYMTI|nr:uncharacterized protein MYCGRDRAFT_105480 [Zymoseptoria tritici IPO323]EGP85344.1 hypothetical protein MYCGRDRAFT_105480 [Zymoseptoria tritici IPO323]